MTVQQFRHSRSQNYSSNRSNYKNYNKKNPVKILEIETTITKTDQETILNHPIEKISNFQTDNSKR